MQFSAKVRYVKHAPDKLRLLANVIRGKEVGHALQWLSTVSLKRAVPMKKVLASAAANAKHLQDVDQNNLFIKEIRVDQGRMQRYYKPGAMGRSTIQRKRFSHISVLVESVDKKEAKRGTKG